MSDQTRNLHPHAEARLAMALWGNEYAHDQKGGSMDFWDYIGPSRRRIVVDILNGVIASIEENGRAKPEARTP